MKRGIWQNSGSLYNRHLNNSSLKFPFTEIPYVNTYISYLTKQFQVGLSVMGLAHGNVLFGPEELPTFKNSEISQETIDFWLLLLLLLFSSKRSGYTGPCMHNNTTTS